MLKLTPVEHEACLPLLDLHVFNHFLLEINRKFQHYKACLIQISYANVVMVQSFIGKCPKINTAGEVSNVSIAVIFKIKHQR